MKTTAEENIATVQQMFDDWNARRPMGPELLDPEVQWDQRNHPMPDLQRVYRGRDGVREFWVAWLQPWKHVTAEIRWIHALGDRVIAWVDMHMVAKESGLEFDYSYAWDILFLDGRFTRVAYINDEAEALATVGAVQKTPQGHD